MDIPDEIGQLAFSVGSDEIRYLTAEQIGPLIGVGTPYLEELVNARCGNYTNSVRDSDERRMQWWRCYYKAREEEVRAGMSVWAKTYQ